jgi:hypothetical protein
MEPGTKMPGHSENGLKMTYATALTTPAMIEEFAKALETMLERHMVENHDYAGRQAKKIEIMRGLKYTRLVDTGSQRCCYGFIENATGLLFKSESWKKPAKHPRGTLHTPTGGIEFAGPYGFAYLR